MLRVTLWILLSLSLTACNLIYDTSSSPTRSSITLASVTPNLTPPALTITESPYPADVYDALGSTVGVCFEAAWDAAGQVFVLRNSEEHIRFYDGIDNSRLCRRAIQREPFDFSTDDALIGVWNRGLGCTASHEITSYERDDSNQVITLRAQFSTEGTCPYELVRGLWLGIIDAQSYQINLIIDEL